MARSSSLLWKALSCYCIVSLFLVAPIESVDGFKIPLPDWHWLQWFSPTWSSAPHFTSNELYNVDTGLGSINGHVASIGDFNSDKFTDLFVVSDNNTVLRVFLWSHSDYEFQEEASVSMAAGVYIAGVAAGDFDHDGKMDCLVMTNSNSEDMVLDVENDFDVLDRMSSTQNETSEENRRQQQRQPQATQDDPAYTLTIYFGNNTGFLLSSTVVLSEQAGHQVLVLDANADYNLDLFADAISSGNRSFWINDGTGTSFTVEAQDDTEVLPSLSTPHSTAVVDLDGNCMADLFVTSLSDEGIPQYEVWLSNGASGFFKYNNTYPSVPGAGQVTLFDVNGDGSVDMVFPVCYPVGSCSIENTIHIVFNHQSEICTGYFDTNCMTSSQLCNTEGDFSFADTNSNVSTADVVIVPRAMFGNFSFLVTNTPQPAFTSTAAGAFFQDEASTDSTLVAPITLRAGDYDLDGFPDLLVPLVDEFGNGVVQLWHNVACVESSSPFSGITGDDDDDDNSNLCGSPLASARRTFQPVVDDVDVLSAVGGAYAATFFDLDESGSLDIIVLADSALYPNSSASKGPDNRTIHTIFNNLLVDAYFIKAVGGNGVCPSWCPDKPKFPDPEPYGVNFPGGVWRFPVNSNSGVKRLHSGTQLSQSAYLSLQTPYIMFGIGRTTNYIEQIYYGATYKEGGDAGGSYSSWICIIPNSQLMALPYKPTNPLTWTLELYINPGGYVLWVVLASAVVCLLLSICVYIFHRREKSQDRKEAEDNAHLFSFGAL